MINKIIVTGNITNAIELQTSTNGKKYAKFTIAHNEKYGEKEETYYFNCIAWEKRAEIIAQYCNKGNQFTVEGKMTTNVKEIDGKKTTYFTIVVSDFNLPPKSEPKFDTGKKIDIPEDDLPF